MLIWRGASALPGLLEAISENSHSIAVRSICKKCEVQILKDQNPHPARFELHGANWIFEFCWSIEEA
jgi:hypothetical protein